MNLEPADYESAALTNCAIGPFVEMTGLEPVTYPVSVGCSNRLSYISEQHLVRVLWSVSVLVTNENFGRLSSLRDSNPDYMDISHAS